MASPPRLIVLMVIPNQFSTKIEISIESGSVTKEMIVVLTLARKRKRTMTTKIAPS